MSAGRRVGKLGLPYRYDSLEELSDGVAAAQSRLAGAVGFGDAAPTETVAIVDSFAPKDEDAVRGELGVVESGYLETDSDETTGHGSLVGGPLDAGGQCSLPSSRPPPARSRAASASVSAASVTGRASSSSRRATLTAAGGWRFARARSVSS